MWRKPYHQTPTGHGGKTTFSIFMEVHVLPGGKDASAAISGAM
jgi:hypothetical protein